jgi:hypothetical protein
MRFVIRAGRYKMAKRAGACALVLGSTAGLAVSGAGAASAGTCTAGTACTATGTAGLTGGSLTLTAPGTLTWGITLNGAPQQVVDTVTADQSLTVDDATGSGAGWNVTVDATTFSTTGGTIKTLADTGTLKVNGDPTANAANTAPDAVCTVTAQCTLPTGNTVSSYPVPVTTAATTPTPATIYTAAASSGFGSIILGSAHPIGWWISLPSNTLAGSYTSTFNLNVGSGP